MHDNDFLKTLPERQKEELFSTGRPSLEARKKQLLKLKSIILEHEAALTTALHSDLGKPVFESFSSEIAVLLNEIEYVCKHLAKWDRPVRSQHLKLGYVEAIKRMRHPYGSVLIIGSWNYPVQLTLMPTIGAIASGNRCVIKPSEHAPATAELLKEIINQTFPPEQLHVVTGDAQTASELTSAPFDLIFFTGSTKTGKAVAEQAAKQLTPVILELGGKNPCIMDETGYSKTAIREIVWGKFLNAGQTCIAPDTLFVHESIYEKTLDEISASVSAFYGDRPEESGDYGRICTDAHFQKMVELIGQGIVRHGGTHDQNDRFIAPTVVTDIKPDSSILQEEIFGPVLPVIPYTDLKTLLSSGTLQRDSLTGYIFSKNKNHIQRFKEHMRSPTISVNQVIHHAASPHIAFGGVGSSGYGAYHGKAGFLAFSYEKTEYQTYHYLRFQGKFPPYSDRNMKALKVLRKWLL
ncbi:aldehyde dehydrogenase (NAD+) [Bacillus mesophilus]|uniref:Aldehyde dehydrogenase n=1 Tax=Bacillus mesophilus TaxID=1808955 RepID=A0A6M0QE08_9BACI|nr:aldehyde dehydrogenase family protein [Bacillus mesophilus]MBM7662828.1 aldehyde dehydrogenase (NAD+) [Bacillus mesophilus]NEY73418.1 aldehyde dehydrogenase family protein [Bacillus mesophilus]